MEFGIKGICESCRENKMISEYSHKCEECEYPDDTRLMTLDSPLNSRLGI